MGLIRKSLMGTVIYAAIMAFAVHFYNYLKIDDQTGLILATAMIIVEFVFSYLSSSFRVMETADYLLNPLAFGIFFAFVLQYTGNLPFASIAFLIMMFANNNLATVSYVQILFTNGDLEPIKEAAEILKNHKIYCKTSKCSFIFGKHVIEGYALFVTSEDFYKANAALEAEKILEDL